jgi:hypothetical protein
MSQRLKKIWLLILLPLAFLLKDLIATMALLATEPGITNTATFYYLITLLPGALFFSAGHAILFNIFFGVLLGLVLYLWAIRRENAVLSARPSDKAVL